MPRYRVGTRLFDTAADAEAYRLANPDAPSVFVEPDALTPSAKQPPWLSRPEAPVIITAGFAAADMILLFFLPRRGPLPWGRLAPFALFYAAYVWRVWVNVSILSSPAGHARNRVAWASFVMVARVIGLALLLLAVVFVRSHDATLAAALPPPPIDPGTPLATAPPPPPSVDGGAAMARSWSEYTSVPGRFTTTFPGAPSESAGNVELHTADGATFTVRFSPLHGRTTSNATRARIVAERDALLARTNGVLLDDRDVPRRDGIERIVRIGVATPPTVVWARFLCVGGMLYVAGVSQPASEPDGDARTFLGSLSPTR